MPVRKIYGRRAKIRRDFGNRLAENDCEGRTSFSPNEMRDTASHLAGRRLVKQRREMMLHAPVSECQDRETRRDRPDLRLSLAMTQPVPFSRNPWYFLLRRLPLAVICLRCSRMQSGLHSSA